MPGLMSLMSAQSCPPGSPMAQLRLTQVCIHTKLCMCTSAACNCSTSVQQQPCSEIVMHGCQLDPCKSGDSCMCTAEWPADPRLRQLGSRAIAPVSPHAQPAADTQHYQHFRFRQGIAEGSELPHGECPVLVHASGTVGMLLHSSSIWV